MRKPLLLRLGFALAGLVIAIYLTTLHYDSAVTLVCSNSGAIDCVRVLSSPESAVLGIPVALFGLIWFVVEGAFVAARLRRSAARVLASLEGAWLLIGTATVLLLVYTELVVIGKICIWCSAVHVLVLALLVTYVLSVEAGAEAQRA